jgi:hypothetical protein
MRVILALMVTLQPTGWTDQPNWLSIKPFIPAKGSDKGTESQKKEGGKKHSKNFFKMDTRYYIRP